MKIFDLISMCLRNLFRRRLRTVLTVIGVVIGTCSIVIMISIGIGMNKSQEESLKEMGDLTLIEIYNYGNDSSTSGTQLNDTTLADIAAQAHVVCTTPFYNMNVNASLQITSGTGGRYQSYLDVVGVYPDALAALGYEVKEGTLFTGEEKDLALLFGEQYAYNFRDTKKNYNNYVNAVPDETGVLPDPFVNPVEDKFKLEIETWNNSTGASKTSTQDVEVCGVLVGDTSKGYQTLYSVFADINQLKKLEETINKQSGQKTSHKEVNYNNAKVKVDSVENVEEVEEYIKSLGFETYSMETVRKPIQEQSKKIQIMLGGIGAISLLVAAIGITNTMIMSIYERTREIGVMKVLGCRLSNIRANFLLEAGAIGFFGGVVGVGISFGVSWLMNKFLSGGSSETDFLGLGNLGLGGTQTSIIPPWLVLLAIVFSTFIGLISGFSPANRAVKISALEAIKHE